MCWSYSSIIRIIDELYTESCSSITLFNEQNRISFVHRINPRLMTYAVSTNISKEKREKLVQKISAIKNYKVKCRRKASRTSIRVTYCLRNRVHLQKRSLKYFVRTVLPSIGSTKTVTKAMSIFLSYILTTATDKCSYIE